jgi:hypothetical protein
MAQLTSAQAREYVRALEAFKTAYLAYLTAGPNGPAEVRRNVIKTIPAAEVALNQVGGGLVVGDPPMMNTGMVYRGLANLAFLHERPGFRLSEPPLYEAVLDSIEQAQSTLEYRAERLEEGEPVPRDERHSDTQPVFCRRGHFLGHGSKVSGFCETCGAPAVSSCANCQAPISSTREDPQRPQSFCGSCGAAFPWVDRKGRIYQLENLLAAEGLDEAAELEVREQLAALARTDLGEDEAAERWQRVKRLAPGLLQTGRTIVEGLASAAVRAQLGI